MDYSVKASDFDKTTQRIKKSHPNATKLNNYLIKKLSEATNTALEVETEKPQASVKVVRNKIKPLAVQHFSHTQVQIYLDELKAAGKYNQYTSEKRIKHFKEFLKGEHVAFSDIPIGLLEKFKNYLKGGLQVGERTAVNHWVVVRSIFLML